MQAYPKQWRSPFPTEGVRGTRTLEMLQSRLYQAAKADRKRRFHTLHDKICRMDILREAWKHVAKNKGAPGIDGGTIEAIEKTGVDNFLEELRRELVEESYRVQCVKRVYIPKPDGEKRPLGIPTVKDRVVQQAVRLIIEPIFEADFQEFSYGYRPNRSAKQASLAVYKWLNYGLSNYFNHSTASKTYNSLQHFLEWKLRKYIAYKHQYRKASTHHTMGGALYQMGLSRLTGRIQYVYL